MLSVWNPILSQGKETRPLSCWMTSCLTLHQTHSLTWHMACTAREDKRNYVCLSSWCVMGEMPAWRADHRACGHSLRAGPRHKVLCFSKYKGQTVKATPPWWTTRCPLAKQWCLCYLMSFSSLQNNVSALSSEWKLLRMHPGEPLHVKNRSYPEWVLPVSPLPQKPSVGRHPHCRIRPEDERVSIFKAPGLEF